MIMFPLEPSGDLRVSVTASCGHILKRRYLINCRVSRSATFRLQDALHPEEGRADLPETFNPTGHLTMLFV
jgi:hypothetical protein